MVTKNFLEGGCLYISVKLNYILAFVLYLYFIFSLYVWTRRK